MHHRTKFHTDQSNRCGDNTIFVSFKMVAAAILEFQKFRIFMVGLLSVCQYASNEVPGEVVGSSEEDLRCRSLLTVCQRRFGLLEAEDMRLE